MLAPNVVGAMSKLGMMPSPRQTEVIVRARKRLVTQGLLKYVDDHLQLTQKGISTLAAYNVYTYQHRVPRRWDKKWRMLIFDIPERKRGLRHKVRTILRTTGFVCIQQSVWLYPYDCEEFAALMKTHLSINKEILYVIVDSLENDLPYRKHFSLPSASIH